MKMYYYICQFMPIIAFANGFQSVQHEKNPPQKKKKKKKKKTLRINSYPRMNEFVANKKRQGVCENYSQNGGMHTIYTIGITQYRQVVVMKL